eukprot:m.189976 g.189976  ORF g.189976 m.189976 type:complete len:725 (-) comp18221_c0_seq3:211-2385(-)
MALSRRRKPERLYEAFFLYTVPPAGAFKPELAFQHPQDYPEELKAQLPKFCFPYHERSTAAYQAQVFTFTFTAVDGCHQFGFCRQVKPDTPASESKCFCLVSYLPWFSFFHEILRALSRRVIGTDPVVHLETVLAKLSKLEYLTQELAAGQSVPLELKPKPLTLKVPDEQHLPKLSSTPYLSAVLTALSAGTLLRLFTSALAERRIIVCSSNLGLVTGCVHALHTLLYPLVWQHVFIPIMPSHLLDYCCAPVPFLVGVHLSLMPQVRQMPLEDYVLLFVDENAIETPFTDLDDVPYELTQPLKSAIKKGSRSLDDSVPRAFLKFFVRVMSGYGEYITIQSSPDDDEQRFAFDADEFVLSKPKPWHPFMQQFVGTQPFQQFIDQRIDLALSGESANDLFEEHLAAHERAGARRRTASWKLTLSKVKTRVSHKVTQNLKRLGSGEDGVVIPELPPTSPRLSRPTSQRTEPTSPLAGDGSQPVPPPRSRTRRITRTRPESVVGGPRRPASETFRLPSTDEDSEFESPPRPQRPRSDVPARRSPPQRPPPPRTTILRSRSSAQTLSPPPRRPRTRVAGDAALPNSRPASAQADVRLGHVDGEHPPAPSVPGTNPFVMIPPRSKASLAGVAAGSSPLASSLPVTPARPAGTDTTGDDDVPTPVPAIRRRSSGSAISVVTGSVAAQDSDDTDDDASETDQAPQVRSRSQTVGRRPVSTAKRLSASFPNEI